MTLTDKSLRTSEEDCGLWSVWIGGIKQGYIWEPDAENRIMAKVFKQPYTPESEERFIALDDWVDGVTPGNRIAETKTWHQALKAVLNFNR